MARTRLKRRLLDTSRLIGHWHDCGGFSPGGKTVDEATDWAQSLIQLRETDATVTPVVVEFLAGVRSAAELLLARAYLAPFRVVDDGRISAEDWEAAKRIASRVPRDGKPRHLGDCLLLALARRLRYEIDTLDKRFAR